MPGRDGSGPSGGRGGAGQGRSGGMGGGRTGGGRPGAGPGGNCVCPQCGYTAAHQPGRPCMEIKCPKCGISLRRE